MCNGVFSLATQSVFCKRKPSNIPTFLRSFLNSQYNKEYLCFQLLELLSNFPKNYLKCRFILLEYGYYFYFEI